MRGIGVGYPEKLAAAHFNYEYEQRPDTRKRLDSARSPMNIPPEIRLARFRRGTYPDPATPRN